VILANELGALLHHIGIAKNLAVNCSDDTSLSAFSFTVKCLLSAIDGEYALRMRKQVKGHAGVCSGGTKMGLPRGLGCHGSVFQDLTNGTDTHSCVRHAISIVHHPTIRAYRSVLVEFISELNKKAAEWGRRRAAKRKT